MADSKKKDDALYKNRYKTLKEHRAAVAARKQLKGGKNVGPVKNSDAYGSAIKPKPKPPQAGGITQAPKPKVPKKKLTPTPADKIPQSFKDGGKGGKYDKAENKERAASNFYRSSSGTRGSNVKSNPALKSQPKQPKRSDFQSGRAGAKDYAAAMKRYRAQQERLKKNQPKPTYNRRGRRV